MFGDSAAGSLKLAIQQLGYADTNKVISFRDRFSIGPLWKLHDKDGWDQRNEWIRDHINDEYNEVHDEDAEVDYQNLIGQIEQIPAQAE